MQYAIIRKKVLNLKGQPYKSQPIDRYRKMLKRQKIKFTAHETVLPYHYFDHIMWKRKTEYVPALKFHFIKD